MRRTFPRIPSSPQATTTVETPAHYALTLICCSLALFVRGGDGECRAEYVFCSKERCKIIKKMPYLALP